ncbi:hypothetical protein F4680DRAFT_408063 [Xylaria scruposa]|nr:hypothetical protein F4680DRAFT_408063 [Xylaria scruposa]
MYMHPVKLYWACAFAQSVCRVALGSVTRLMLYASQLSNLGVRNMPLQLQQYGGVNTFANLLAMDHLPITSWSGGLARGVVTCQVRRNRSLCLELVYQTA